MLKEKFLTKKRVLAIVLIITMLTNWMLPVQVFAGVFEDNATPVTTQEIELRGGTIYSIGANTVLPIEVYVYGDYVAAVEFSILTNQSILRTANSATGGNSTSVDTFSSWGPTVYYSYYDEDNDEDINVLYGELFKPTGSSGNITGYYGADNASWAVFGWQTDSVVPPAQLSSMYGGEGGRSINAVTQRRHIATLYYRIVDMTKFNATLASGQNLFEFYQADQMVNKISSQTGAYLQPATTHYFVSTSMAKFTGTIAPAAPSAAKTDAPSISNVINDNGTVKVTVDKLGTAAAGSVPAGTTFKVYDGDPASGGTQLTGATASITAGVATISITDTANSALKKKINLGDLDGLYIVANDGTNDDSNAVAVGDVPARTNTITNSTNSFDYSSGTYKYDLPYGVNISTIPNPFTLRGTDTLAITYDPATGAEPGGLTSITVNNWSVSSGSTTTAGAITLTGNIQNPADVTGTGTISIVANILPASSAKDVTAINIVDNNSVNMTTKLDPAFAVGTTSYDLTVNANSTSVTITPTISADATATINESALTGGQGTVTLGAKGSTTTATIRVTAQDNSTKDYTIDIYRPYDDAELADLGLAGGISIGTFVPSSSGPYSANVTGTTSTVTVDATAKAGAGTQTIYYGTSTNPTGTNSTITLNAAGSSTTIYVKVVADDGTTTKEYAINVARAAINTEAKLFNLTVTSPSTDVAMTPSFVGTTKNYTINVPNNTTDIVLKPTALALPTEIKVNGTVVTSGTDSAAISLNTGATLDTPITITTLAEDGVSTETYNITVHRRSTNSYLSDISIVGVTIPGFDKDTLTYNITLPYGATTAPSIAGTLDDTTNAAKVETQAVISGGTGTATIVVTPEEGTARTYEVIFTADSTRPSIAITGPNPAYAKENGEITYTATYTGVYGSITLTPGTNLHLIDTSSTGSSIKSVNIAGNVATIIVEAGSGNGTVAIKIDEGSAKNVNNSLAPEETSSAATIKNTAPVVTGITDGEHYNTDVTPATSETVTVKLTKDGVEDTTYTALTTITANAANEGTYVLEVTDQAGNTTTITFTIDVTNPTITSPANNAILNTDVTPVYSDDNLDYATLSKNGGADASYTQGTPITDEGVYVLTVYDKAGNSSVVTFTIDTTAPTMTIGAPSVSETKTGAVTYTVTYETGSTITLANANVSIVSADGVTGNIAVSGSGDTRTVTVSSLSGDGKYKIEIAAGTASDAAGNTAASAQSAEVIVDNTAPVVTFVSNGGATATDPETQVTVIDSVVNGVNTGIAGTLQYAWSTSGTVTPGSWTNFTSGDVITNATAADGTYYLWINAVSDNVGNTTVAQVSNAFIKNSQSAGVAISAPDVAYAKSGDTVTFTIDYTNCKNITLSTSDITVTGGLGTVQSVTGSGDTRTVTILVGGGNGNLGISIPAGTADHIVDGMPAAPAASSTGVVIVDNTAPTFSGVTDGGIYNTDKSVTINEPNIDTSVLVGTNPSSIDNNYVSGTPITDDGVYTLTVTDETGHTASITFTIDKTAPDVTGVTNNGIYDSSDIPVTPVITDATSGIDEITLNGVPFTSGTSITSDGTYTLVAKDNAGNETTVVFTIDTTKPTVTISKNASSASDVNSTGSAIIDVAFADDNLDTTSLVSGDITVKVGGTAVTPVISVGTPTGTNPKVYPVTISGLTGDGALEITVAAGKAVDLAGNTSNSATQTVAVTVDNTDPEITYPVNNAYYNADVTPAYSDDNFDKVELTKGGTAVSGYAGAAITDEGVYILTVYDKAGNSLSVIFTIDKTKPTMVIGTPNVSETKAGPVTYTVTYTGADSITLDDSDVSIISADGITGTIAVTGSGNTRTITVSSLSGDGKYKIEIAAGTASDLAGNTADLVQGNDEVIVDNTAPVVTFVTNGGTVAGDPSTKVTVVDPVGNGVNTGIAGTLQYAWSTSDSVTPGSWTNFTSGDVITRTGSTDGTYYLWINAVSDNVGNTTAAQVSNAFVKDNSVADLTISGPSANYAKQGETITFTATYENVEESSISLSVSDITVNGGLGTVSNVSVTGSVATISVLVGSGDGTLGISIAAGTADHIARPTEKAPAAGPSATAMVDNTKPTTTISKNAGSASDITSTGSIIVDVAFTDANLDTTSLVAGDITVKVGGTAVTPVVSVGTVTGTNPKVYPVTISGLTGDGALEITVAAGKAVDKAGNASDVKAQTVAITVDNTDPVITAPANGLNTNQNVTPAYSDDNLDYVTLTKDGTAVPGYAGTVITDEGVYVLTVYDKAGNSTSVTFTIDKTAPTMTIGAPSVSETKAGPVTYTVTYTGADSITLADANVSIVSADGVTGDIAVTGSGNTRTVTVSNLSGDGKYKVEIAAGTASDLAGNTATSAQSAEVIVDNTAPVVTFVTNGGVSSVAPSTVVTVVDQVVNGVNTGIAGTLGYAWSSSDSVEPGSYTTFVTGATITEPTGVDGTYYLWIKAVVDNVGNTISAQVSNAFIKDDSSPSLTIANPSNTIVKQGDILTYTVTYENVNASTIDLTGKVSVSGSGTVTNISVVGNVATITVEAGSGDGTLTLNIAANTAEHTLGSGFGMAPAASNGSVTVDNTDPAITAPADGTLTNQNVTPAYSDTNLDYATLSKDGGAHNPYTGGTPITVDGTYVLTVYDLAGNSSSVTFTIDKTAPVITAPANGLNTNQNVTPVYSDDHLDYVTLTKDGTAVSGYNGEEITDEGTYVLTVYDEAGNSSSVTFVIKKTAPTMVIGAPSANITSTGPITYTVTYEVGSIITLSNSDVTLVSTPAGAVTGTIAVSGSGNTRTITVSSLSGDGAYTLQIAAGTASDNFGNSSLGGTSASVTVDNTAPTITSPVNGAVVDTDVTPVYSDANLDYATLSKDGGAHNTYTGTTITADGTYVLTVYDKVGHSSQVTFTIDRSGPIVTGISINTAPSTLSYNFGDAIDLTGLVLDVTYSYGPAGTVTYPDSLILLPNGSLLDDAIGTVQVTVSYKGATTTFNVTVSDVRTSIIITGPTKTSYEVGDTLATAGITVTEVWGYAGNVNIPLTNPGVVISGYNTPLTSTDNKVTVAYGGSSQDFPIVVTDVIDHIEATLNKTNYKYGEALDITVEAVYKSNARTPITGYTTNYSSTTIGNLQSVTVTYVSGGNTFTDTVVVNVRNYVTDIELIKPTKNKYKVGDTLDLTGGSIREVMADGTKGSPISLTSAMIDSTSYNMSVAGGYNVKVAYTDADSATFTKYFPILVTNPADTIAIDTQPKADYNYGDALDLSTGKIKITKHDGVTEEIINLTDSRITVTGYNPTPTGFTTAIDQVQQTLTITYTETVTEVVNGETITDTVTKTIQYTVTTHDVYKGIEIVKPNKLEYTKGEDLDLTGGKVREVMASGVIRHEEALTSSNTAGYDSTVVGTQTLTVTHLGETKTFTVTVTNPAISISMNSMPDKTSYKTGEALNVNGGKIKVVRQNGEEEIIDITLSMVSGYNKDKAGTQVITVTFEGKTTQFTIEVTKSTSGGGTGGGSTTTTDPTEPEEPTDVIEETVDPIEETEEIVEEETKKPIIIPIAGKNNDNKDMIVKATLFTTLFGLLLLLLLAIVKFRKNIEIYEQQGDELVLVAKDRISKNEPSIVLDRYIDTAQSYDLEVVLKKSISKQLDNKKVHIIVGGNKEDYKVNYNNEAYEIRVSK